MKVQFVKPTSRRNRVCCTTQRIKGESLFFLLLLLYSFSSCMREESVDVAAVLSPSGVAVEGVAPVTRADNSYILRSGSIGIFKIGTTQGEDNVKYTYANGQWDTEQIFDGSFTPGIPLTDAPAKLAAYYPYKEGYTIRLPLSSAIYNVNNERYESTFTATKATAAQNIVLTPLYCRMKLRMVRQLSFKGAGKVSQMTMSNILNGKYDVSDGRYTNMLPGNFTRTVDLTAVEASADATISAGATADLLLIPYLSNATGFPMELTVDGKSYTGLLPASVFDITGGIKRGFLYSVDVLLGKNDFTVVPGCTSSMKQGWGEGTTTDGGEIILYPEEKLGYNRGMRANSYVILPDKAYYLNAKYEGNGVTWDGTGVTNAETPVGTTVSGTAAGAKLVWQSATGLITDIGYADGIITFKTGAGISTALQDASMGAVAAPGGNAVIAVTDASNNILWSWHLWVVADRAAKTAIETGAGTGNKFMDRNLGAFGNLPEDGVKAYGLLYQWGRKDPFPSSKRFKANIEPPLYDASGGSVTITKAAISASMGTLAYVTKNPLTFVMASSSWLSVQDNTLWGSPDSNDATKTIKTKFDPCPAGYKVPPFGTFGMGSFTATYDSTNKGISLTNLGGWIPCNRYRNYLTGMLNTPGEYGYYWMAAVNGSDGYSMILEKNSVYPTHKDYCSLGFGVRCVKE